ncbi:hypothetical protein [Agrobacterium tumefaciens]|uniref:Uncharacterized protein n=1 Tax=Agrobacterium tumefaciens TaxID=358 RepID=A0AA44JAJ9_AGRTU|nr:hypothetical protein [Agrobacterium tumefaciens]NSL21766.1 hypothetical protein [Agrobacterium tumefaciens]NTB85537.1 hypothetical protein [Agrobacterium tumefaciens]NTC18842.1 hypothetical protein [Agrobacterium tumefaciens]NTC30864.1 hypothetical protein [Agrobacterium tumefaciens]NTC55728.1 hypothetical protein [Agrobacterium tumefaciens]
MSTERDAQIVNINVLRHNLDLMSMYELNTFMAAVTAARDALTGVENQPRCTGKAMHEVDDLVDGFNRIISMVDGVAKGAKPQTKQEAVIRAVLIMHNETQFHDEFESIEDCFLALKADMAPFREGGAA